MTSILKTVNGIAQCFILFLFSSGKANAKIRTVPSYQIVLVFSIFGFLGTNGCASIPLHNAVKKGDLKAVETLIENRVNVNGKDSLGQTPLFYTAFSGNVEVAKQLIAQGAKVNAERNDRLTPLHAVAEHNHPALVTLFLDYGALISKRSRDGTTPLHSSALGGAEKPARILIRRGADLSARLKNGHTPLHIAAIRGHANLVALLLENGADIEATADKNVTPLHEAAFAGHAKVAALLIVKGANVDAVTSYNKTPLQLAEKKHHRQVAALLRGDQEPRSVLGVNELLQKSYAPLAKGMLDSEPLKPSGLSKESGSVLGVDKTIKKRPEAPTKEKPIKQSQTGLKWRTPKIETTEKPFETAKNYTLMRTILESGPSDRFVLPDVLPIAHRPVGRLTIEQNEGGILFVRADYEDQSVLGGIMRVNKGVSAFGWIGREVDYLFRGSGRYEKLTFRSAWHRTSSNVMPPETARIPLNPMHPASGAFKMQITALLPMGVGSVHRFKGEVNMTELALPGWFALGARKIIGDINDPLVFLLTKVGYVYLSGNGRIVVLPEKLETLKTLAPDVMLSPGNPVHLNDTQRSLLNGKPGAKQRQMLQIGRGPEFVRVIATIPNLFQASGILSEGIKMKDGQIVLPPGF